MRPSIKTPLDAVITNIYGDVKDGYFECYAGCGALMNINTKKILHRGHITSYIDGGGDDINNLRPECESCNLTHGTQNMFDYMKTYKLKPPVDDPAFNTHVFNPATTPIARNYEIRQIRHECVNKSLQYYSKYKKLHGIISAPTGAGKTLMALETVGRIMNLLNGGVILWITERKDIIGTQFTPYNIMSWKDRNIIPKNTSILFKSHLKYCDKFPKYCIIASTIDTALAFSSKNTDDARHFQKLKHLDNFLGVIVDETHMAGGDRTYEMIRELIPHSTIMLGLSATHKFDARMNNMYASTHPTGKINQENIFLEYNYMQAVRDGIIRQVDFKISRADRIATDVPGACLFDRISEESRKKIFDQIIVLCNGTFHKKGIMWCGGIKAAEKWFRYCEGRTTNVKFVIDHSHLSTTQSKTAFDEFCNTNTNIIMISARKHSQGIDVANLDFGAIIDDKAIRDIRVFLQMVGRLTRKSPDCNDNAIFCEFVVCVDEAEYTRNMKQLIEEYYMGICERFSGGLSEMPIPTAFETGRAKHGGHIAGITHTGGLTIQFEILDGLSDINIFSRDEAFIANLLCRTQHGGIDYEGIKTFLKLNDITEPAEAEMLFRELYDIGTYPDDGQITLAYSKKKITIDEKTFKGLVGWWGIVRYMGINYNILLDIDSGKYYKTLEEAKRAISNIIYNIENYQNTDIMKLYNVMRELDNKLPPDPLSTYSQK